MFSLKFRSKRRHSNPLPASSVIPSPPSQLFGPPEIASRDIVYNPNKDILGEGSYGTVYKAMCHGTEVAVKVLKQSLSVAQMSRFLHEAKILSKIYHPNVVMFMGACTEPGKLQLVTERCKTDLETLLHSSIPLTLSDRMRMARDAALGMTWLHDCTKMVHRDLKTSNLLIDANGRVKIADFGFCQIKDGSDILVDSAKGTMVWMAPEVLQKLPYTEKVDVYSFGIILWEVLTRSRPYPVYCDPFVFSQAVCYGNERPPMPLDTPEPIKKLISKCWAQDPADRYSFEEIVYQLSEIIVDCEIEDKVAAEFWKDNFIEVDEVCEEDIPWSIFQSTLCKAIGHDPSDISFFNHLQTLLVPTAEGEGEKKDKVTMARFNIVVKWFGHFFTKENGPTIIQEINELHEQSWFHGEITSNIANSRLSQQSKGTFLIRLSLTSPSLFPFTLSIVNGPHTRIEKTGKGLNVLGMTYRSLFEYVSSNKDFLKRACPRDATVPYSVIPTVALNSSGPTR